MYKRKTAHDEIDLSDDLAKIKAALAEATRDVKGKASELIYQSIEDAKEKTAAAQDSLSDYVAEKPLKSLGIAMAVGVAIGWLIRK